MQSAPKKWTHHHVNRLFHMSMLVTFVFASIIIIYGLLFILINARALVLQGQGDVAVSAVVPGIVEAPPQEVGGPAGQPIVSPTPVNSPTPTQAPTPSPSPTPTPANLILAPMSIAPAQATGQKVLKLPNGKLIILPSFNTQYPAFSGTTGINNADIFLSIRSYQDIRSSTYASIKGDFLWQSPEPVSPGQHTVAATAQDPNNSQIQQQASLDFYIELPPNTLEIHPNTQPPPAALGNGGNQFDVLVHIPPQFKKISPGDNVVVGMKFINLHPTGKPVEVNFEYTWQDSQGRIILQRSGTVKVDGTLSVTKVFTTNPDLPEGLYTITVRVPSKDSIAVAQDSFELWGGPIMALGVAGKIDFTVMFQALLGLLFIFALLVYFEYNKVSALSGSIKKVDERDIDFYNH